MVDCANSGITIQGRAAKRKIKVRSFTSSDGGEVEQYEHDFLCQRCTKEYDEKEFGKVLIAVIFWGIVILFIIYKLSQP
jgi:hypothetical protein